MPSFETDVLTDGEILENTRHHFPGCTHPISDILLGEFFYFIYRWLQQ